MPPTKNELPGFYAWLHDTVQRRFAGEAAMQSQLARALSPAELKQKGDDRFLSAMSQRVFQAGVRHSVVDAKWPEFETAFGGFEPEAMAKLSSAQLRAHLQNPKIIRHLAKLETIPQNARFILEVRAVSGAGFGAYLAGWPSTDIIGLWRELAKRGARLGGRSGAGFLRLAGKDTFLLTSHVVARLVAAQVVASTPTNQRDLQSVQDFFNELQQISGRPLCELSSMMALSILPD